MTQALRIIKVLGAWGCIVGAVVAAVMGVNNLFVPLGILSIAFSLAPVEG